MNDTDELLGYDADHDDPSQYCPHGTWIGSWWGPDYLCQWCEDGVSPSEMRKIQRATAIRRNVDVLNRYRKLCEVFTTVTPHYDARIATLMTTIVWESQEVAAAIESLACINSHKEGA